MSQPIDDLIRTAARQRQLEIERQQQERQRQIDTARQTISQALGDLWEILKPYADAGTTFPESGAVDAFYYTIQDRENLPTLCLAPFVVAHAFRHFYSVSPGVHLGIRADFHSQRVWTPIQHRLDQRMEATPEPPPPLDLQGWEVGDIQREVAQAYQHLRDPDDG